MLRVLVGLLDALAHKLGWTKRDPMQVRLGGIHSCCQRPVLSLRRAMFCGLQQLAASSALPCRAPFKCTDLCQLTRLCLCAILLPHLQELAEEYGRHRAMAFNVGVTRKDTGVRYKDVAGIDHIRADIEMTMSMVLGDERYKAIGAKPPRVSCFLSLLGAMSPSQDRCSGVSPPASICAASSRKLTAKACCWYTLQGSLLEGLPGTGKPPT